MSWQQFEARADNSAILKKVIESHVNTDSEFSDMSFQLKAILMDENGSRQYLLDFWSKEGRYYRLDTTQLTDSGERTSSTERMIIRPEGYAMMRATDAEDANAIVELGPAEEGLDRLAGNYFFNSSTRHSGIFPIRRSILSCLSKDEGWTNAEATEGENTKTLQWKWSGGEASTETEVRLNGVSLSCVSSIVKNKTRGKMEFEIETAKQCDENSVVPVNHIETWTYSDGAKSSWNYERIAYSFDSPPIEVFALPIVTSSTTAELFGVWGRRLFVLTCGIVLLTLYFLLRSRSRLRTL